MRATKHILWVVFLLCVQHSFSQVTTATLSGKITSDNKPLPGATVTITYPEAGITKNIVAQTDGSFVV